ncbi:MAG: NUDIX hydrolase [Hyphomicrobium sp.]
MNGPGDECPSQSPPPVHQKALRPRDAATLIIFDRQVDGTRILMGRRRMDQIFLPGHYVFPGGRIEPQDKKVPVATPLQAGHAANVMIGMGARTNSAQATALALAAVRETFEETGYVIGQSIDRQSSTARGSPASRPAAWQKFMACGYVPALGDVSYFARAITPPGRPRRYDTRFFAVPRGAAFGPHGQGDGELEDVGWRSLDEVRGLKLPSVTRLILEDFSRLLAPHAAGAVCAGGHLPKIGFIPEAIPFYFQRRGVFQRAVLSLSGGAP